MPYETLVVARDGPVMKVTLNRPEARNALSPTMVGELSEVFTQARDDASTRAVVLAGAGGTFCAGGDLKGMEGRAAGAASADATAASNRRFGALLELAKLDGCWIKVSGAERISPPPFNLAVPIASRIMAAIPDRVLWGTDFPHPNLSVEVDEADLVDLVPAFAETEAAQRRLLVDNPARLYGF